MRSRATFKGGRGCGLSRGQNDDCTLSSGLWALTAVAAGRLTSYVLRTMSLCPVPSSLVLSVRTKLDDQRQAGRDG